MYKPADKTQASFLDFNQPLELNSKSSVYVPCLGSPCGNVKVNLPFIIS